MHKKYIHSLILLAIWILFPFISTAQNVEEQLQKAQFLIENHMAQTNTPGVQVAVMIKGELVWSESWGFSNLAKNESLEVTTPMRVASVSKSMTSVALGKLVEEGLIDLDEDVRTYVPSFPKKVHKITTRQLAASSAGIRHYTSKDPILNQIHYPTVSEALEVFKDDPLLFEPDTDYHYSSYGWVLLSAAMEAASKTSFDSLMQNTWFELRMQNTYFDHANYYPKQICTPYILKDKSFFAKLFSENTNERIEAPDEDRSFMYAGGGFLSTAEDLVKMGTALLQNNYLKTRTTQTLFSSHELKDGTKTYYGLGWETGVSRKGTPIVYHSGSMKSARSHLIIYPEKEVVVAYIANTGDHIFFNDREAQLIAELFIQDAENTSDIVKKKYEPLVGEWHIATTSLRNKKTEGRLNLKKNTSGVFSGEITFTRSKEKKSFPIVLTDIENTSVHLVAVSPMFIDFYIQLVDDNSFKGEWLHDFNVKGIEELDEYWDARSITGTKRRVSED